MIGYFEKTRVEDIIVERVNLGKVTLIESKVFWERLRDDIVEGNKKIIADLSSCKFIDSSLIGVIVRAQDLLHKNQGILKIVTPCNEILEIFELIKVSGNLNIYEILDDAVKSFNVKTQIGELAVAW
ncbi:MAG: STAS domain-containing protein [Ignavibacteria bacterium]|nr:STAS domain-containing protein [Ignavibacteria bacterium]MBT8392278.1 STAS domain-containing protein [Ignavibacteria bacterium]NNJ53624.1 STAS domain-containing protein [Ignavibacteriaceae bacterium]NNL20387.1 STAS domain-containing protein [Ignavibacteriaceae bacterium]